MRLDVAKYLTICVECQQVKSRHQHPVGRLQQITIAKWKWEVITLYFFNGLPISKNHNDSIMEIVDKLNKKTHFILVKSTFKIG